MGPMGPVRPTGHQLPRTHRLGAQKTTTTSGEILNILWFEPVSSGLEPSALSNTLQPVLAKLAAAVVHTLNPETKKT